MNKIEFIKQIRKKHKMSRKKFAELLEVSPSTIEKAEKNLIPLTPNSKYIKAISALEGLDNEIFKYDEIDDKLVAQILNKPINDKFLQLKKDKENERKCKEICKFIDINDFCWIDFKIISKLNLLPLKIKEEILKIAIENEKFLGGRNAKNG